MENRTTKGGKRAVQGILMLAVIGLFGYGIYHFSFRNGSSRDETVVAAPVRKQSDAGRKALNVNALVIRFQPMTDEIYTNGNLLPDEEVDLSFETSGKITEINFTEGAQVKKGQLLAKVNDKPLQAQLKKLEAQLKLAQDRVFRQNALLVKDAVSKEAYEQVKTDLAALNADIELVKANIAQTELRAPFDGVIGLRLVSEGAYASPNTVVAKLTKISPIKIDFSVPERYARQIVKGTPLTFTVEGKLQEFHATVYATESKVDPVTRTLPIRARYENSNGALLPGRYANVRIRMNEIPRAIAVPSEAIVPEMGIDKVFLYKSGKVQPVEVKKGLRTDALVQIVSGLQPGDTLITSGTLQLRTGLDVVLDEIE